MTDTGWTFEGRRVIESEYAPDPGRIKHLGTRTSDHSPFLSRIINTCDLHGAILDVSDPVQNMRAAYDYHTRRSVHNSKERTMTTLYKPVLIESAAQAEALPVGTVAIDLDGQGQPRQASIRVRCGWYCTGEVAADGSPWLAPYDAMVGDYALVPVEAVEEYVAPDAITYSRYVTAWEEA